MEEGGVWWSASFRWTAERINPLWVRRWFWGESIGRLENSREKKLESHDTVSHSYDPSLTRVIGPEIVPFLAKGGSLKTVFFFFSLFQDPGIYLDWMVEHVRAWVLILNFLLARASRLRHNAVNKKKSSQNTHHIDQPRPPPPNLNFFRCADGNLKINREDITWKEMKTVEKYFQLVIWETLPFLVKVRWHHFSKKTEINMTSVFCLLHPPPSSPHPIWGHGHLSWKTASTSIFSLL